MFNNILRELKIKSGILGISSLFVNITQCSVTTENCQKPINKNCESFLNKELLSINKTGVIMTLGNLPLNLNQNICNRFIINHIITQFITCFNGNWVVRRHFLYSSVRETISTGSKHCKCQQPAVKKVLRLTR